MGFSKGGIIYIVILILLIIIGLLYFLGKLYFVNNIIPHNPIVSCQTDTDCTLIKDDGKWCEKCSSCNGLRAEDEKLIAIRKDWKPYCPFQEGLVNCPNYDCAEIWRVTASARCINNKCEKVINSSE